MRTKDKPFWASRTRVEPATKDGLFAIYESLMERKPDGFSMKRPAEEDISLMAYFDVFRSKDWRSAIWIAERGVHKHITKPVPDVKILSVTVQVHQVKDGEPWPPGWYDLANLEALGNKLVGVS